MQLLFAFFSGVGVSVVGALLANVLTRQRERQRVVKDRQFGIYMKLMDLYAKYFWFTTAELHKEEVPAEVRRMCHDFAGQIADMLRSIDEFDLLEDTHEVTLGPSFDTAASRYKAMGKLIDGWAAR